MITPDERYFIDSLRRVLYISRILQYEVGGLRDSKLTSKLMVGGCIRIDNAIKAFFADCMCRGTHEQWQSVKAQLNADQLHDLSLLLDTMKDVVNIGDIVEVIKEAKKQFKTEPDAGK